MRGEAVADCALMQRPCERRARCINRGAKNASARSSPHAVHTRCVSNRRGSASRYCPLEAQKDPHRLPANARAKVRQRDRRLARGGLPRVVPFRADTQNPMTGRPTSALRRSLPRSPRSAVRLRHRIAEQPGAETVPLMRRAVSNPWSCCCGACECARTRIRSRRWAEREEYPRRIEQGWTRILYNPRPDVGVSKPA